MFLWFSHCITVLLETACRNVENCKVAIFNADNYISSITADIYTHVVERWKIVVYVV